MSMMDGTRSAAPPGAVLPTGQSMLFDLHPRYPLMD